MAKKGGVQQLQTEINTSEELVKFLEKDGLLILDVYTEWCGPCLAMVGSLKKIKLEQGGDDLQLAVVKCDHIEVFERFRNRSEPTWLFASKGKLINSAFGSNAPDLMTLITAELAIERETQKNPNASGRQYYELTEMTPKEQNRYNQKEKIREEAEKIELEAAQRRRKEYLTYVTDRIMMKARDCGVTVFLPHLTGRDLFKRVADPAEKFQLTARDKKIGQILDEHLEVIHFECDNPMPQYVIDHLLRKDVFMVCWKLNDSESRTVTDVLMDYVAFVAHEQDIKDEFGMVNPDVRAPALLRSLSLEIEVDDEEEPVSEPAPTEEPKAGSPVEDDGTTEEQENCEQLEEKSIGKTPSEETKDKKDDVNTSSNRTTPESQMKRKKLKTRVRVPGAWTPANKRAQAAMIYLYFRHMTELYLAPDPPPDRPHLTLIYDAYKRKELMDVIEQYSNDVLAYGYFTTDDLTTATLIANSTFNYHKLPPTIHDKMVLKVARQPEEGLLAFSGLGPSYISRNTEIGRAECDIFFPPGYTVSSETGEPEPVPEEEKPVKKKKKKKKGAVDVDEVENPAENNVGEPMVDQEQEESELGDMEEDDGDDDDEAPADGDKPEEH